MGNSKRAVLLPSAMFENAALSSGSSRRLSCGIANDCREVVFSSDSSIKKSSSPGEIRTTSTRADQKAFPSSLALRIPMHDFAARSPSGLRATDPQPEELDGRILQSIRDLSGDCQ